MKTGTWIDIAKPQVAIMVPVLGWLMIAVSGVVLFIAFPGEYGGALLPQFIGRVGIPFGLLYIALQYAVAAYFGTSRVLWFVTGWFAVGAIRAIVGWALDINRFFADYGASFMEYLLCSGSCTSGMAFGIAIVRGWVYDQAD
jgi:hypothetical protein